MKVKKAMLCFASFVAWSSATLFGGFVIWVSVVSLNPFIAIPGIILAVIYFAGCDRLMNTATQQEEQHTTGAEVGLSDSSVLLCDPTHWSQRCIFTGWQWQRRRRGGCWEYWHFIGWQRSTPEKVAKLAKYRPAWAQENWGV